jgi:hypothetical protein
MAAATLPGRLACAAASAYAVVDGENTLDRDLAVPYYAGVGYQTPPAAFLAGDNEIDACTVGTTADGVVVAFRGTLPIDGPFTVAMLLDWVNDLNARPIPGGGLPGAVHEGFLGSLNSLWDAVRAETKRQLNQAGAGTPLMVTGHSKGGAVAALAAMRFHQQDGLMANVVTFAAPKPGNTAFTDAYNAVIDHTRYEFGEDVVPHLPPSVSFATVLAAVSVLARRLPDLEQFDYGRVGKLIYITRAFDFVADPANTLLDERRNRIVRLILTGNLQQIGDDHRIGCGCGYMSALNPAGVCPPPAAPAK